MLALRKKDNDMELLRPLSLKPQVKEEFTSLALKALLDQIGEDWQGGVLDLGAAVGTNLEFFSERSCNLYIADLFRALEKKYPDWNDAEAPWDSIFTELLAYDEDTRFQLILAWDVLNYLRPFQIQSLSRCVHRYCRPGTLLFALISTRKAVPARPRNYHVLGSGRLLYQTPTQAVRPSPLYREPQLRRMLPGFQVQNTFLLRNGIQEYLFTYST